MLEIFCLIWLWNINGRNAIARGQHPRKYRIITLTLWFGLEILGTMVGVTLTEVMNPSANPLFAAYFFGILGAIIGGWISFLLAKHAPQGNYRPENPFYGSMNSLQNGHISMQANGLTVPATIKIVEEYGGYTGGHDSFFLNGYPVCSLQPGSEYTFTTQSAKNILTIGRPTQMQGDTEHEVRFVAAENGYIEIHAAAGKLIPQQFVNYTS